MNFCSPENIQSVQALFPAIQGSISYYEPLRRKEEICNCARHLPDYKLQDELSAFPS
jgi:hypothetical protein